MRIVELRNHLAHGTEKRTQDQLDRGVQPGTSHLFKLHFRFSIAIVCCYFNSIFLDIGPDIETFGGTGFELAMSQL